MENNMDLKTACFLKNYCRNIIKWWFVAYNTEAVRIWPSQQEKEDALKLEALEQDDFFEPESLDSTDMLYLNAENDNLVLLNNSNTVDMNYNIPNDAYNATTGSYSGLYGQKPVDEETQKALDLIMGGTNQQNTIDFFLLENESPNEISSVEISNNNTSDIIIPPEQDEIIKEANLIYQRLLNEAAEDEVKKRAEIEQALNMMENGTVE